MTMLTTTTKPRRRLTVSTLLLYVALCIGAVVVIYLFFYMVINSLKTGREILNSPTALPSAVSLAGYQAVFDKLNVLRLFLNTVFLAGSITLLNTILSALAGYAFAKIPFPDAIRFSAPC